jgi:hypothetical protein
MFFGIGLKNYERLVRQGDKVKNNFWTAYLLLRKSNRKIRTKNILALTVADFVDCERYFDNAEYYNFCNIFVKKWQKIYVHNLESIIIDYAKQKENLIEMFPYVFNPPSYGLPQQETQGSELRKEFVKEFGNWVVLMDLVCKDKTRYKEVENWKLEEFLFWANYLTGQKILETVK